MNWHLSYLRNAILAALLTTAAFVNGVCQAQPNHTISVTAAPMLCLGNSQIIIEAIPDTPYVFSQWVLVQIDGQGLPVSCPFSSRCTLTVPLQLIPNQNSILEATYQVHLANVTSVTPVFTAPLSILPYPTVTYPSMPLCNSPGLQYSPTLQNATSGMHFSLANGSWIDQNDGTLLALGQTNTDSVLWVDSSTCNYTGTVLITFQSPATSPSWNYGVGPHCAFNTMPVTPNLNQPNGGGFTISPSQGIYLNAGTGEVRTDTLTPPGTYQVTYTYPLAQCSLPSTALLEVQNDSVAIACPTDSFCEGSGWTLPPTVLHMPGISVGGLYSCPGLQPTQYDTLSGAVNTDATGPGTYQLRYRTQSNACNREYAVTGEIVIVPAPDPAFSYPQSTYCQGSGFATPDQGFAPGGQFGYVSTGGSLVIDSLGVINLAASDAGTYTVWHSLGQGQACVRTDSVAITLVAPGTAITVEADDSSYCVGDDIELTSSGAVTGGIWAADPPNLPQFNPGQNSISFIAQSPGAYWITYTGPGNCSATGGDSVWVTTPATTTLDYQPNSTEFPYCAGADTFLTPLVAWPGTFTADTTVGLDSNGWIDLATTPAGVFSIYFQPDGCFLPARYILYVDAPPPADIAPVVQPSTICTGDMVTLSTTDNYTHRWYLNGQLYPGPQTQTFIIDSANANDTVTVTYISDGGCTVTRTIPLPVLPVPAITIEPETHLVRLDGEPLLHTIHADQPTGEVLWHAETVGSSSVFANGILELEDSIADLIFHPVLHSQDTMILVTFTLVPTANGCPGQEYTIQDTIIHNMEPKLHIPGVFTPDGDAFNDTWVITIPTELLDTYRDYQLLVFNRAGAQVHHMPVTEQWRADGFPAGVYQYILIDQDDKPVTHGGLTILK